MSSNATTTRNARGLTGTPVVGRIPRPVAAAVGIGTAPVQRDEQH